MATNSLGKLTLDLVLMTGNFVGPMSRTERQTRAMTDRLQKQFARVATAVAQVGVAAAATAAGGILLLTKQGLQAVDSQANLARSLDTTYDSVTALQLAFSDGGIDNFEASVNRLNRRLGAAELGRGAALKAVEELNLNLRELASVDADERLAIIADRIKEVSTNSQTAARYAQDLGFEQAEAAQFFMQGGDAIRAAREEIEAYGLSLSAIDVAAVEEANNQMDRLGLVTQNIRQQLAVYFAPMLLSVAKQFNDMAREAGGWGSTMIAVLDSVVQAVGFVLNVLDLLTRVFRLAFTAADMAFSGIVSLAWTAADAVVNGPLDAVNLLIRAFNSIPGINIPEIGISGIGAKIRAEQQAWITSAGQASDEFQRLWNLDPLGYRFEAFFEQAKLDAASLGEGIESSGRSFAQFGDDAEDAGEKAVAATKSVVDAVQEQIDAMARLNALLAATPTAQLEKTREDMLLLRDAFVSGLISVDEYFEAVGTRLGTLNEKLSDESVKGFWDEWLESAENALLDFDQLAANTAEQFQRQFGSAFERMVFDSESFGDAARGLFQGIARSLVNALGQMAAQWVAYQAVQMAQAKTTEAAAIASAAGVGTAIASAYAPAAAMASLASFGANSAPAIAGITSTVSVAQGLSFAGLFDKGGRIGAAEFGIVGERGPEIVRGPANVTGRAQTANMMGRAGGTTVNLIEDRDRAGEVESGFGDDGEEELRIFVSDIRGGGRRSQALEATYGLQRVGS